MRLPSARDVSSSIRSQVKGLVLRHHRLFLGLAVVFQVFNYARHIKAPHPRCRVTMPDWGWMPERAEPGGAAVDICSVDFNHLGAVVVDQSAPDVAQIEAANWEVQTGGRWVPEGCTPRQTVAILVPYRDRWRHLQLLMRSLHPMMRHQNVSYQVFVIEQAGNETYNKGILFNAGIVESLKLLPFDCFIFHDVDLLPEDERNIYHCDEHLRHFSPAIDEWRYTLLYPSNAGGVVSLSYTNVVRINGFSNSYWGWGGEDDDFSYRTLEAGLLLTRPPQLIGRYAMIRHPKRKRAESVYYMLDTWRSRWKTDGLNSLNGTNYKILNTEKHRLYTRLLVDVGRPPGWVPPVTAHHDGVSSSTQSPQHALVNVLLSILLSLSCASLWVS